MGGNEVEISMMRKAKGKEKSKRQSGGKGKGSPDAMRAVILQIMRNKGSGKGGWNPTAVGCNKCGKPGLMVRDCTSKEMCKVWKGRTSGCSALVSTSEWN